MNDMAMKVFGKPLYQWDTGRKLTIEKELATKANEIQFYMDGDKDALIVMPIIDAAGQTVANIPNILLQRDGYLIALAVSEKDGEEQVLCSGRYSVFHRAKPSDYVYEETEIFDYKSLLERVEALEKGASLNETDPTVPDWAKAPEKPSYTAEEVGALSKDSLQSAVDLALLQAKQSGMFDGAPGYTPQKGVDYYTEGDKAEMVNLVLSALPPWEGGAY